MIKQWDICSDDLYENKHKVRVTINNIEYSLDQNFAAITHCFQILSHDLEIISEELSDIKYQLEELLDK